MNLEEEWRPIPDYDDSYEVSSHGRVRTLRAYRRWEAGRILKPWLVGKGYPCVGLWRNGKRKRAYIHHLVAAAFHGERPAGLDVLHRDDVKTNNNKDNLYYGTQSENNLEAGRNGSVIGGCGEVKAKAKLTAAIVVLARQRHAAGESYAAVALDYDVNETTMRRAILGETWAHVGMPGDK